MQERSSIRAGARLLRDTNSRRNDALVLLSVAEGLAPVAFTVAAGAVIASVSRAVAGGAGVDSAVWWSIGFLAATFVVIELLAAVRLVALNTFRIEVENALFARVSDACLAPAQVHHLEDEEFLGVVRIASSDEWPNVAAFVEGYFQVLTLHVSAFAAAVIVALFNPALAVGLVAFWLILGWWMRKGQAANYANVGEPLRRASYLRQLLFEPTAAKEVRLFAFGKWVADKYSAEWYRVLDDVWKQRKRRFGVRLLLTIAVVLVMAAVFVLVATTASSPAQIVVVTGAILLIARVGEANEHTYHVAVGSAAIPSLARLERLIDTRADLKTKGTHEAIIPVTKIRFEKVSFTYPGQSTPVYDGLDLVLEVGKSLAIVGANGAGKTTLVKLLARLYEPTAGRILADGIDIATFEPAAWQRQVAAIFQDFVEYPESVVDNISFGAPRLVGDLERCRVAAERVGALDLIEGLPHQWETILNRQFEGGTDLSGGQWQRIALARALFAVDAGASILVLDEPTANLDVRAEVELFNRFLEVTQGATTVLISHRFSTVQRADRIVVLSGGRVVESGHHDELIQNDGYYAKAFALQARHYVDEADNQ